MIEVSTDEIPVNPERVGVQLSRADVWRGLLWKAEAPTYFVPSIVDCRIVERFDDGFLREIWSRTPDGDSQRSQERILFDPEQSMTFLRLSGSSVGQVVNAVVERPSGELFVQFRAILAVVGAAGGSSEEDAYRAVVLQSYVVTWDAVLRALREMKRTGLDPLGHLLVTTAST